MSSCTILSCWKLDQIDEKAEADAHAILDPVLVLGSDVIGCDWNLTAADSCDGHSQSRGMTHDDVLKGWMI